MNVEPESVDWRAECVRLLERDVRGAIAEEATADDLWHRIQMFIGPAVLATQIAPALDNPESGRKVCTKCKAAKDDREFPMTRYGTRYRTCKECAKASRLATMAQRGISPGRKHKRDDRENTNLPAVVQRLRGMKTPGDYDHDGKVLEARAYIGAMLKRSEPISSDHVEFLTGWPIEECRAFVEEVMGELKTEIRPHAGKQNGAERNVAQNA